MTLLPLRRGVAALIFVVSAVAGADQTAPLPGDYGGTGLWQTPTARFGSDGHFAIGVGGNSPYNRFFINVQPFEWLETTFRYTDITNRLYSPNPAFSGNQSYKDRGVDLRARLLQESEYWPQLAFGIRDLGGTQLFGSQYLVASAGLYDFDLSLGLGWGRLGSGGPIANPFERQFNEAESRNPGNASFKRMFASPNIGVFGGVSWAAPIEGLHLVAEYDSNDYQNEPFDNDREVRVPINVGLKYARPSGLSAGVSWQRGEIVSVQLAFAGTLGSPTGVPKLLDPPPVAPRAVAATPEGESAPVPQVIDPLVTGQKVERALKTQRINLTGFSLSPDGQTAWVWIPPPPYRDSQKQAGRAARAASAALPDSVASLKIIEVAGGVETYELEVVRPKIDDAAAGRISVDEFERAVTVRVPESPVQQAQYGPGMRFPAAGWSLNPSLRTSVGGPDEFLFYQLWLKLGGYINLAPGLSVDGLLGFNLYNNFGALKLESDSQLPRVRSDIKNYLKEGDQALVRLETNYIQRLAPRWYGRVSAGIFEEMYGGVATEVLYRPADPRFAVGLNVNRVRQRDFDQRLTFRDYEVTTGHLTGYFEFARPSVLVKLSVGRYLAGDEGGTIDVSRQFPSGIRIGAFATKTNVSAAQFGEGEFDKGIYFVLPLDALLPRSTSGSGSFGLRPLTRDGGQMVRDGRSLYDLTYGAVKVRSPLRDKLFFE